MKMEEGGVMMLAKPVMPRPKLKVQPRNPGEGFIQGGLNSATPSPMLFASSLHGETDPCTDSKPYLNLLAEALASPSFSPTAFFNSPVNRRTVADTSNSDKDEKPPQVELSEMGKADADSHSISSAKYKALMPSRLPITSSSPHLTISPGISPATLLESPIFFNMSQVDPSPTTGTFSILPPSHGVNNGNVDDDRAKSSERNDNFIFKPFLPSEENNGSPAHIGVGGDRPWQPHMGSKNLHGDDVCASDSTYKQASSFSSGAIEPQDNLELMGTASAAPFPLVTKLANGRLSTDGYNWKKYGQKTLKNSENPRSYYKCTYPNCLAKKQVECSPDEAEITEIIYKGKHNHPKPDGTRKRAKNGSSVPQNSAGGFHDRIVQDSGMASKMHIEKTSVDLSASYVHSHGGLSGTPEFSFTSPSNEDDENGEASTAGDGDEDEPHSKHRRIENQEGFSRESVRTAREPRVVVQTVSERDILDDGYRWRKYGQKVVKGHHYPRNYYKCTNIGCKVRKHVERSSTDAKCVMTTYEGKHNHCVPPPRGNMQEPEEEANAPAVSYPASPAHIYGEGAYGF